MDTTNEKIQESAPVAVAPAVVAPAAPAASVVTKPNDGIARARMVHPHTGDVVFAKQDELVRLMHKGYSQQEVK